MVGEGPIPLHGIKLLLGGWLVGSIKKSLVRGPTVKQ